MTPTQIKILAVLGGLVGIVAVFTAVVFALDSGDGARNSARATLPPATQTAVGAITAVRNSPSPTPSPTGTRTPTSTATPTAAATPARAGVVVRAPAAVNVRGGPSTEFSILATLQPGDELPVSGRNADSSWLLVTHPVGTGWVAADVVQVVNGGLAALPVVPTPMIPRPPPAPAAPAAPPPAPAPAPPPAPAGTPTVGPVRTAPPAPPPGSPTRIPTVPPP